MPTAKHRIAAYLSPEVDEKFQIFKQERGVGDSQALILILTEFLQVSHQVSYCNSLDVEALKSELLGEIDIRFSELKNELLSESLRSVEVSHDSPKTVNVDCEVIVRLTIAQLSKRFDCDPSLMRKQKSKYKDEPEKFIAWSKSRDPDGRGWKFDEQTKLFAPIDG